MEEILEDRELMLMGLLMGGSAISEDETLAANAGVPGIIHKIRNNAMILNEYLFI